MASTSDLTANSLDKTDDKKLTKKDKNNERANSKVARINRLTTIEQASFERILRSYNYTGGFTQKEMDLMSGFDNFKHSVSRMEIYIGVPEYTEALSIFLKSLVDLGIEVLNNPKFESKKNKKCTKSYAKKIKIINEEKKSLKEFYDTFKSIISEGSDETKKETLIKSKLGEILIADFIKQISEHKVEAIKNHLRVSKRGKNTCVIPCKSEEEYFSLTNNKELFKETISEHIKKHSSGHKEECSNGGEFNFAGKRSNDRKTLVAGGAEKVYQIQLVVCKNCKARFSIIPSFLPREKHFQIDLIGQALNNCVHYQQSLQAVISNFTTSCRRICKQTVLNWIRWAGTKHPAEILSNLDIKVSGYFQEDEGFEKEPNLRTYTTAFVDVDTHIVWHIDYLDHVSEDVLTESFSSFSDMISFKILGCTKDKWVASTNAMKKVFSKIWIGYCQRHFLVKLHNELSKNKEKIGCSYEEYQSFYSEIKKIINESNSAEQLRAKLTFLIQDNYSFYENEVIANRLDHLYNDASHYTMHNKRQGITKATTFVDSFLKQVKRKLKQAESFKSKDCTRLLFRTMANLRNFIPFDSSSKNAKKSPFQLADGNTYGVSWMQAMNVHKSFLFV